MTSKRTTHFQKTRNCKAKWIARHRSRRPSSHVRRKRARNESWWFERHYQQLKLLESDGWRFESSQADYIEISPVAQLVEHLISKHVSCIFHHHIYADGELNPVSLMFQRQSYFVQGKERTKNRPSIQRVLWRFPEWRRVIQRGICWHEDVHPK